MSEALAPHERTARDSDHCLESGANWLDLFSFATGGRARKSTLFLEPISISCGNRRRVQSQLVHAMLCRGTPTRATHGFFTAKKSDSQGASSPVGPTCEKEILFYRTFALIAPANHLE